MTRCQSSPSRTSTALCSASLGATRRLAAVSAKAEFMTDLGEAEPKVYRSETPYFHRCTETQDRYYALLRIPALPKKMPDGSTLGLVFRFWGSCARMLASASSNNSWPCLGRGARESRTSATPDLECHLRSSLFHKQTHPVLDNPQSRPSQVAPKPSKHSEAVPRTGCVF